MVCSGVAHLRVPGTKPSLVLAGSPDLKSGWPKAERAGQFQNSLVISVD